MDSDTKLISNMIVLRVSELYTEAADRRIQDLQWRLYEGGFIGDANTQGAILSDPHRLDLQITITRKDYEFTVAVTHSYKDGEVRCFNLYEEGANHKVIDFIREIIAEARFLPSSTISIKTDGGAELTHVNELVHGTTGPSYWQPVHGTTGPSCWPV